MLPEHLRDLGKTPGSNGSNNKKPLDKHIVLKAAKTILGLIFGHELLLTALPFLKRFVKANVKVTSKGSGAVGAPGLLGVPKIGTPPSASPFSAIRPDQANKPIPKKTKNRSGNGRGFAATILAVAACIGLFVFLRNDGVATSQPRNEWETLARSIVYIEGERGSEAWSGSGSLIIDGSYILTNFHVAPGSGGIYSVYFTDSFDKEPDEGYSAEFVVGDEVNDLAILQILDSNGEPIVAGDRSIIRPTNSNPGLNEELTIIGYPGIGFSSTEITMTITKGNYSGKIEDGVNGEYYKTDGNISGGVSGGAAFNSDGVFVGVPSAHYSDSTSNAYIGLIKPSSFAAELISKVKP